MPMVTGTHILFYSKQPEADRAFFRDVLQFPAIDAGRGWLLFAMPPAEAGFHPADDKPEQLLSGHERLEAEVYLMCDNVHELVRSLEARGVGCGPLIEAPWGSKTTITLPSGGAIGVYQPTHPTALDLNQA